MTEFNENLYYTLNQNRSHRVSISTMKFPGGEVGVNINTGSIDAFTTHAQSIEAICLVAKVTSSDVLMQMFMATDALRRVYPLAEVNLLIPYFPYARQDRVCNAGEALSVKVVAQLINAMNYATVTVVDPHSPVLVAALDRCFVVEQSAAFKGIKPSFSNITIVAPDVGAIKKTEDFAKLVGAKDVLYCNKKRNLKDGKILGFDILNVEILNNDSELLVLDDICDGGRTFLEVANAIDNAGYRHLPLELAVTHGIFSKGLDVLTKAYDHVYTTNTLPQADHPQLTVVKL